MINETRTIHGWSAMSHIGNQGIAICPDPLWPVPHHLNSAKLMADDICCSQLMGLCCQTAKHACNISWIYGGYICLGGFLILCWRSSADSGCVLNHFNPKNIRDRILSIYRSIYLSIYYLFLYLYVSSYYVYKKEGIWPWSIQQLSSSTRSLWVIQSTTSYHKPLRIQVVETCGLNPHCFTFNVVLNDTCL